MQKICILPRVEGTGGMASFRIKFESGLKSRGLQVTHDLDQNPDALLVIAGTRHLAALARARRRGVRIVQRLDGINWIHRKRWTGVRHFLRAEYGNLLLSYIRSRLASRIVYQSEFSRGWWEDWYGAPPAPAAVVHNGVDLEAYNPKGVGAPPRDRCRLLVVEGSLGGGYDMGLDNAVRLSELLAEKHGLPMELMVVGRIAEGHKAIVEAQTQVPIIWAGTVPRENIPEIDRSAHLLFSADLNPACPNSVIEALACGLPVVAFDTGALNELIRGDAGRLVPYGGNPWKLERPDLPALAEAAAEILQDRPHFSREARAYAESALGLDRMVAGYLSVLLD
jgi:glycosyltransferase involved in cell wall biosynthesis